MNKAKVKKDHRGYWLNGKGDPIPPKLVPKIDREKTRIAHRIANKAVSVSNALVALREFANTLIENYLVGNYDVQSEDWKGNLTLLDFSGTVKVEIKRPDLIQFDEHLQHAKMRLDELLDKWTDSSRAEIKVIVNQAFSVDKKGDFDKKRIFALLQLEIRDKEWRNIMEEIRSSIKIVGQRAYMRVYVREVKDAKWTLIPLNFSSF